MAGMLPGVESARRRRVWQSSSGAAEAGAARRQSLCLYAGGLGRGRDLGSPSSSSASAAASSSMVWSGAGGEAAAAAAAAMARAWSTTTLGSDAREAKERLDHKLRGQRQPVVLNRHQMSTRIPPAKPHGDAACSGTGGGDSHHRHHSATTTPCGVLLQREVLSSSSKPRKGGGCRFGWCRRLGGGRCEPPAAEAEAEAECAVCLGELRAGDVVARLPCAHRFHWSCAVPWVQAVSRCPVCRAHVVAAAGPS